MKMDRLGDASTTLLVLDDDMAVARTLALMAESQGLVPHCFDDPARFLAAIDDLRPGVVALDLVMPRMDGVEVMRQLAQRRCEAAIILISGMGQKVLEAAQATARERGLTILGVLPKPFKPQALRELLERRVASSGGRAAARPRPTAEDRGGPGVSDLAEALGAGAIDIVAQPKIALASGGVCGAEILARWTHPTFGVVPPDRFVPLAEQNGLLGALTEAVLEKAMGWFRTSALIGRGRLAVNLSTRSLVDVALADRVMATCARHGVPADKVILEITETSAMDHTADSFDTLTRLRLKGFHLSIDDFGTGYSSLAQLVRLPLSEIKIDRSFVMRLEDSTDAAKIVDATIRLSHAMSLVCVAEGVEDETTLDALTRLGCDQAQGYFVSRPMKCAEFDEWLTRRHAASPHAEGTTGDDRS
jgi:EAL domain-containing protein (putative c-di-GMP-specific phosphodiesterase class I)/CheY-like chemotaxis protein